jgi:hypothetical protein
LGSDLRVGTEGLLGFDFDLSTISTDPDECDELMTLFAELLPPSSLG